MSVNAPKRRSRRLENITTHFLCGRRLGFVVTILAGVCMVVSPGDHAELRPCSDDRFISVHFAHGQILDRLI